MPCPKITLSFPPHLQLEPVTLETGLFINNEFVESASKGTFETINPTNGKVIGSVSEAKSNDVDVAVKAASEAFDKVWGLKTPGASRGKMLMHLADKIEANLDTFAAIEAMDNGKAFTIAKGFEIPAAAECMRYYGGWADKNTGQTIEVNESKMAFTMHEPIGVVGQIIPWNFPLLMLSWKVAPALATGNTVVLKPSEQTPLTALYLCQFIKEIFPPGVVNILPGFGPGAGQPMVDHPLIEKIAFTGSTAVGKQILARSGQNNLKKVTLELGGKSPNIIFDDADFDQAVKWAEFGLFFNQGQICSAGSRVFVQEGIYDKFVAALKESLKNLKVGDPFDASTFQGPQISQLQYDRIMGYIKSGKDEGATCLLGGDRHGQEGFFIQPTIFTDVKAGMKICKEEIFGPVVVVMKFKDEEDAIRQANDTVYGLVSAIHSTDITKALRVSKRIKAGTVWINCYNRIASQVPFGGYKESGLGRECGSYALSNYTAVKSVFINMSEKI
ncbi:aldehyde dehydrogenase (NAD(P)(+)) ald5, variant 2 [Puccinia graminis f. sp. tritici]|uniref:Aldehyde dehydrogenase (NAD(P)(+)) ald5 n=1 Tax=Puccinia graminis f. sp. tritici TaxID=56615 RepID=A0A5B0N6J4_PUCGR|nr:aldehyde dehydrogenase (NAD(P)(+)) ald5 [Puccinia graminis f. sp. tritici]KAA1094010.1 aldehyde dehydrogenase (NAD(P)(+)) ald5, variant 2 [Puccinia graminis f. sp. tritici]